jgi:hypothetical protein
MVFKLVGAAFLAAMLSCTAAAAQEWFFTPETSDEAIFGFAAAATVDGDITHGFEPNYIFGGAYQRFLAAPAGVRVGVEAGLAGRIGAANSAEAWAGIVARVDVELFDLVRFSPSIVWGVSAVTAPMAGGEAERTANGDPHLLFYLGPELAFSPIDHPETEVFIRNHHRSGAWKTLGNVAGAQDSIALGLRHHF